MSGFHLASIGFLGTSGCTALHPGFGLIKSGVAASSGRSFELSVSMVRSFNNRRRALCVVPKDLVGKPSCKECGVVRQLGTRRNQLIPRITSIGI